MEICNLVPSLPRVRSTAFNAILRACVVCLTALCAVSVTSAVQARTPADISDLLRTAIKLACPIQNPHDAALLGEHLPGFRRLDRRPQSVSVIGWRAWFVVVGGTLTVERIAPGGALRSLTVEYRAGTDDRPHSVAMADLNCGIQVARRVHYDDRGRPAWIENLDAGLDPIGAALPYNPPVPSARDPGGILVALIDTGVNYLLPELSVRLARDRHNGLLGYDYWDLDRRPFDADPVRSLFFPSRHGTRTASVVAAEAPVAKIVPYRYPRPDMSRMGALVDDAARHHVRLVNMSLASRDFARWVAYHAAARRHPNMLFVVAAGNDGRDIDQVPMYPAALPLANQITVTAATHAGRLMRDANWGRHSVDLMVPAAGILVTGFDGKPARASGSSYATARVTALAACLLAANPSWSAEELKQAILARAISSADSERVAHGFLADPVITARGACPGQTTRSGF